MSTDYTRRDTMLKVVGPTDLLPSGAYPNTTTAYYRRGTVFAYDQPFKVRGFMVSVITTAASDGHVIALEKSSTSGSFASPTVLASITVNIANTQNTALAQQTVTVADEDSLVEIGECLRLKHTTASAADATLVYVAEVIGTPRLD